MRVSICTSVTKLIKKKIIFNERKKMPERNGRRKCIAKRKLVEKEVSI